MPDLDKQQIELVGRSWLEARLIRAGLEVARPARDRGIDLIAFGDTATEPFWACPIQLKAASHETFSLDRKYADRGIVMAYVWHALTPDPLLYLVPYDAAVALLGSSQDTKSWSEDGRWAVTRPSVSLKQALEPYRDAFGLLRQHASALGHF